MFFVSFLLLAALTNADQCYLYYPNIGSSTFTCDPSSESTETMAYNACIAAYGSCYSGSCGNFYYYYNSADLHCDCTTSIGQYQWIYYNYGYTQVGEDYGGAATSVAGDSSFVRVKASDSCDSNSWILTNINFGESLGSDSGSTPVTTTSIFPWPTSYFTDPYPTTGIIYDSDCWREYYYQWNGYSEERRSFWDCASSNDDYWQETTAIVIILCIFLPIKAVMLLFAGCGGCQSGGCGDTCCSSASSTGCCGTRGCWACTNLIFGVLSLLMDMCALILYFHLSIDSWWLIGIFVLFLPTVTHFRLYRNLRTHTRAVPGFVQFQGVPQHEPQPSSNVVQYCPSCAGPFMMPSPAPPAVICPHCQRPISASMPVAVPAAMPVLPPYSPQQPQSQMSQFVPPYSNTQMPMQHTAHSRSAVPVYTPQQMQMQMQMQVPAMYPSQQMQTQQVQMMALPVADVVVGSEERNEAR